MGNGIKLFLMLAVGLLLILAGIGWPGSMLGALLTPDSMVTGVSLPPGLGTGL